ncbi:condensation domain-containing protein, partial [Streptomyces noursei]|uniref:condensation domain-containing protein n=1 Tax=Streptomyces noursei TaxID=1971 RepID=UPI0030F32F05
MNTSGLSAEQAALLEELLQEQGITGRQQVIAAREHDEHPPLSLAQEQMWFSEQLSPGNSFFNLGPAYHVRGPLDLDALRRALTALVARHNVLRSRYPEHGGTPRQRILPVQPYELDLVDVSGHPEPRAESGRIAVREMNRPFDLAHDSLLRTTVVRVSSEEHVLAFTFQHIVADGTSVDVFLRELESLYTAETTGRDSALPELPIQYADFAAWQREWLQTEEARQHLAYWRDRLTDAPALLDLPTDRPRPATQSFAGAAVTQAYPAGLTARLEDFAKAHGVSMFMVMLTALKILLSRYSGQNDLVVGTPAGGRSQPELDQLIGCFFNVLPLRTELSGDLTVLEVLDRVRDSALDAYAHQNVPFQTVMEQLGLRRDLSHNQFTQVLLSVPWEAATRPSTFAGLGATPIEVPVESTVSDLMVHAWPVDGQLCLHLVYAVDLFDVVTVERFGRHFVRVLEWMVSDPSARVSGCELLS